MKPKYLDPTYRSMESFILHVACSIYKIYRTFGNYSGVGLSPLGIAATSGVLYKPQMIDEGHSGAIGGMKIGRGNRYRTFSRSF
jgi:hypothetical protein